jgi:hypothetical protein
MRTVFMLLTLLALAPAQAQENSGSGRPVRPAPAAPGPDQLEPAVDTTAATTPDAVPAQKAAAAPAAGLAPKSDNAATAGSAAAARRATGGKPAATERNDAGAAKSGARAAKGPDRVELETTEITGNRELPKVLYIVPWKRSDLGDLVGRPPNSLLDEVLQPIDRDVFLRENRYYDALKPDAAGVKPGTVPGSGDKP